MEQLGGFESQDWMRKSTSHAYFGLRADQVVLNKRVVAGLNESFVDSEAERLPARTKDSEPSLLVSVVIPTRNRKQLVLRCLSSVYQSTHRPLEVVVVDDCSTDATHEAISQRFPAARLLRNSKRRLLAGSRNLGLRESSGQYMFLLDDDNVVDPAAVTSLLEGMRLDERVGVVAPVTYYLGDAKRIWWAGARMNHVTSITAFPYRDETGLTIKNPYLSQMFHNAFMMRRRVVENVGFFDEESFPIFLSEADYSERMRRLGYRVLVVPSAKVWHDVPPPRGGFSLRGMHITDPVRAYFVARNRIILMWRYRKVSEFLSFFLLFEPVIVAVQLLSILLSDISEKPLVARRYIRGVFDVVRKRFRP